MGLKKLLLLTLLAGALHPAAAQCVMCYRNAAAQSRARAQALNAGIVVLGAPPVLILAGFLLLAFRRRP